MYRGRKSKELIGKDVLVHPDLTTDPAGMQGSAGWIIHDNGESVTVAFEDAAPADYCYDGLLVLADKKSILSYLLGAMDKMAAWEKSWVLDVLKLQHEGNEHQALILLGNVPAAIDHCTYACSELKEQIVTRNKRKLKP